MVELECPNCKILIDIPKGIDTNHYDGIIVCQKCELWLDIKLVESKVRKRKVIEKQVKGDIPVSIIYKKVEPRKEDESDENIERESLRGAKLLC